VAADSLGAKRIGAIAWDVTQQHVKDALLLPDAAIRAAQLWLWKEMKLAVEPAAALGLAALQTGAYAPRRRKGLPGHLRRQRGPGHAGPLSPY
jgi:threonine dehydratase